MKKIIIPALFFSLWMALLSTDFPVNGKFLPALGRFMNPFHGVWQNVQEAEASTSIKGLVSKDIQILFDARDIPHIYAANMEDALYAQGFLHASNRLFAMDISTRAAAGRLSEMIGQRTLLLDQKAREKGFEYSAINKAAAWEKDPESKMLIGAYTEGVNAYIHSLDYKDWPIEYKLLSHAPVEWSMTHSALAVTSMAIALCMREDDENYAIAKSALSSSVFAYLYPDHNPKESPVIPSEKNWDFTRTDIPANGLPPATGINGHREDSRKKPLNGSNNWAVSGDKTANGHPILANDPHLNLTLPNIWYEMEIHTPELSVHGVSLPGTPFIVSGFNEHIAWGFTNSGQDVLDWYKIAWEDSTRQKYFYDGAYVKAQLRPEVIDIRGVKSIIDTIRYTHFGPVSQMDEHRDLAMKWIGHEQSGSMDVITFQKINQAKDQLEFSEAIKTFVYPAQNMAFASTAGDISLTVAGKIPIRPDGQGESVVDGDQPQKNWQGWIPQTLTPYELNPKRGFVSSANQAPVNSTYPYPVFGKRVFEDYRGRIINQVLDTMSSITVDDMKALQQNNFSLLASEILPVLLHAVDSASCLTENEREIAQVLRHWNYEYHRDSISPVYFDLLFEAFEQLTWDELLNADIMLPEDWRLIEIAMNDPTNTYFDILQTSDVHENLVDIACAAFSKMIRDYHNLIGESGKNWGTCKASTIPHLARFQHFGVDSLHTSGGRQIVNSMKSSHGPSWRIVVELTNPPQAWVNYPGGQSGNPASKHYKDMVQSFFEGEYFPVTLRNSPGTWEPVKTITIHP